MKTITIIVETPAGSANKYAYDEKLQRFKLSKVLPAGMVFPYDFGFIPRTKGEDGDPLDVIVISEFKTFTGCAIDCRIIGSIKANQTENDGDKMRNDRFIGIPAESAFFKDMNSINQLPQRIVQQLEDFFMNYNREAGKAFEPLQRIESEEAYKVIDKFPG